MRIFKYIYYKILMSYYTFQKKRMEARNAHLEQEKERLQKELER